MAAKRRTETNIRRELIAVELERLRQERQGLLASNAILRGLLHEFLSTHCAPLELRERALAAVGKPPLEFARKEHDCE